MNKNILSAYERLIGPTNINVTTDLPVMIPPSENLLVEIVRKAHSENHKIAVLGGETFPNPHPSRDVLLVSTAALSSVKEVNPEDFIVITQAGARVDDVALKAVEYGLLVPLDITSGAEATVGGAYMTGAIGPSAAGYGSFRQSVIGVRCVTTQGDIITGGGRTTKNVTGYDIPYFLAGTMGLYAIAFELTIKVSPLPETRTIVVGRFPPGSKPFQAVNDLLTQIKDITMLELIAQEGLGREITVGVGFEGMESLVRKSVTLAQDILNTAGTDDVSTEERKSFMTLRRKAAKNMTVSDFFTISVPPSSSMVMMQRILNLSMEMPVLAHPAIGRFHVVCSDAEITRKIKETALAIGGKLPLEWSRIRNEGISHQFTESELRIARSLKRELDPSNMLNPHLKLL